MYRPRYFLFKNEPNETAVGGPTNDPPTKDYEKVWTDIPNPEKIKLTSQFAKNMGGKFFASESAYKDSVEEGITERLQKEANQATYNAYSKTEKKIEEITGISKKQDEELTDYVTRVSNTLRSDQKKDFKVEEAPEFVALKKVVDQHLKDKEEIQGKYDTLIKTQQEKDIENFFVQGLPELDYNSDDLEFMKHGVLARARENVTIKAEDGKYKAYRKNGEPFLDNQGNPIEPSKAVQLAVTEMNGIKIKQNRSTLPSNVNKADLGEARKKAEEKSNKAGALPGSREYFRIQQEFGLPIPKVFQEKYKL